MHLLSSLIKSLILVVALFKDGKAIVTSSYIFIKVVSTGWNVRETNRYVYLM